MKNEENKNVNTEETKVEETVKTPKMRTKIHIRNPFVAEKIEVPAKEKKAKKVKEPKPETEKKGYLKVFAAGFAAGSAATAGAGYLGLKHRKDAEEDEYEVEEDEVDEADSEDDDDSEDSEDSDV